METFSIKYQVERVLEGKKKIHLSQSNEAVAEATANQSV